MRFNEINDLFANLKCLAQQIRKSILKNVWPNNFLTNNCNKLSLLSERTTPIIKFHCGIWKILRWILLFNWLFDLYLQHLAFATTIWT